MVLTLFAALATGGAVVTSQFLGARQPEKARRSTGQLVIMSLGLGVAAMALCLVFSRGLLRLFFGSIAPEVMTAGLLYLRLTALSFPFIALYNAGAAIFRSTGNSKVSMKVSVLMNIINVAGNALCIFVLKMGVAGVAVPTVVSRAVAAVVMVALLKRPGLPMRVERFTLRHDRYVVKNILRFGVPNGLKSSMFQLGKILLLSTVSVLGTASVAANAIGNTIGTFQCVAGNALGLALVTVVSRCIGAGSYELARFYTKKLMKTTYLFMCGDILLIAALMPLIMKMYNVSPEATDYARKIILMHGFFGMLLWPAAFTLPQALRAAGDTRFTMLVSTASMWTIRVGFGILLGRYWGFGVLGIWMAMFIDWVVRVLFFVPRFHGHKWETMGLRE